ncbi:helix-turn-helix domain-containing protein [Morganella sp. EGD-HP17]|uniref:helix-turn-helix domain-containing protein n=1 Tax=Morganella sp. EGD-HP17 TaxID=1435146 RepID=UPI000447D0B3|nr:helix-turn-helix transcriptional regulator [Morganella sp. EGD-HP17]ETO41121.1 hypothetical protein X965_14575 [Morganella sp. EGD-HP17]
MPKNMTEGECKEFNRKIGAFLRKCRHERSLSGTAVAGQLMISQQQVSRYERGESAVGLFQLDRILQEYGVSWNRFVTESFTGIPYSSYDSVFPQSVRITPPGCKMRF